MNLVSQMMFAPLMTPGARIRFSEEKRPYRVRAANERFSILTKPFNLRHTVIYTVVDVERQIRGPENLIFGAGFETDEQCDAALKRLTSGETAVSSRNHVLLHWSPD